MGVALSDASTNTSTGTRPTVAVLTLGCKLNLAESEGIARELQALGCQVVDRPASVDAFVINSCSVTHVADRKSRHLVRLARGLAPDATILLTGCFPETAGYDQALATGADLVVPSRDKAEVVRRLVSYRPALTSAVPVPRRNLHTRAFVKAQEGCNDVCAFCIVPRTRGRERSLSPAEVVDAIRVHEEDGVQEVVITGTQLGVWGRDIDRDSYGPAALIRAVLAETTVPRVRFSSLQPQDITPELLGLWEDPRLCRHFHLALQSGSAGVLQRMRRRYTKDQYAAALELIRAFVPGAAITTDILAGFPGETADEHAESLEFCREAGFAQMHVFPYSRRPGTSAHRMAAHLPSPEIKARTNDLLALARDSAQRFRAAAAGRTAAVLFERRVATQDGAAIYEGVTDDYIRVRCPAPIDLTNRLLPVHLLAEDGDTLRGALLGSV